MLSRWIYGKPRNCQKISAVLLLCVLLLAEIGCGHAQNTTSDREGLTQHILGLEEGASLASVKSQLGEAVSEVRQGGEIVLNYGTWQLSFVHERLRKRSRVFVPRYAHAIQESPRLDARILNLSLGISIRQAEAALGMPEVIYEIYEDSSRPTEVLRYGSWELSFSDGKLSQRSQ